MNLKKVFLLVDNEKRLFFRSKQPLLLAVMLAGLGLLQFVFLSMDDTSSISAFRETLYVSYNTFVQFLPVVLVAVLGGSVCHEKEKRTWFFYCTKTFSRIELVLSKVLFYASIVAIAVLFAWIVIIGVAWQSTGAVDVSVSGLVYLLLVVLSVSFMITCMEVSISALFSKTAVAGLVIVIAWFTLMIINLAVPAWLGREFLAPYAYKSVQTGMVMRILGFASASSPCDVCPSFSSPTFPSAIEVILNCLYTIVNALVFVFIGLVGVRRD
ncbi:MAG: hypothetical protein KJ606_03405 [Chloroflexi bacterium]|nr:hypothetical protein [Chloroflexota bacterium]